MSLDKDQLLDGRVEIQKESEALLKEQEVTKKRLAKLKELKAAMDKMFLLAFNRTMEDYAKEKGVELGSKGKNSKKLGILDWLQKYCEEHPQDVYIQKDVIAGIQKEYDQTIKTGSLSTALSKDRIEGLNMFPPGEQKGTFKYNSKAA